MKRVPDLQFGVLGPLQVTRGADRLAIPSGRRCSVLAHLIARVGTPTSADALIEDAWAGRPPNDPRAALHTVISRLRSALGVETVRSTAGGYLLDVPEEAIDAARFVALCDRAAGAPPPTAVRVLAEALDLWRGPAYAGFADQDFARIEGPRLEHLRLQAVESLAAGLLDIGDDREAVLRLEPLLAEHPYRERGVELLMTGLYRAGRMTEALERYRSYRNALRHDLGLDPSPALRDLQSRILGHDLDPPAALIPAVQPARWSDDSLAVIGREAELGDLVTAVTGNRMVTVTGTGGVGKTTLVAAALPLLRARLGVPATVVELGPVAAGQVDVAVAEALRLRGAEPVRDTVVEYLTIAAGLLVLDNCEHVLDEVNALVDAVLHQCPRLQVLATSRHRLGGATERVLHLAPLPAPGPDAPDEGLADNPSVRLFTDRLRRVRPMTEVGPEMLRDTAEVCRRLEGIPFAVELAAARAAVLGVRAVLDRLGADPRHLDDERVRDVVEWSHRLLGEDEQALLAALAVFPADFDLEAAECVARAVALPEGGPFDRSLVELVDASLVSSVEHSGLMRYRLPAIVREYAAERLSESAAAGGVHRHHADWVREAVRGSGVPGTGPSNREADATLDLRLDVASALRWCLDRGDLAVAADIAGALETSPGWIPDPELGDLVVDLGRACTARGGPALGLAAAAYVLAVRGDVERGISWALRAQEAAVSGAERRLAWTALGVASLYAGDLEGSARWWREILRVDDSGIVPLATAHLSLALVETYRNDLASARQHAELALLSATSAEAPAVHSFALYAMGEVELRSDVERGMAMLLEAAEEAERAGVPHVSLVARLARTAALVRLGRADDALEQMTPILDHSRRLGAWPQLWTAARVTAELLAASARPQDAAFLLAAAEAADTAPPVAGDDIARYRELGTRLNRTLGGPVHEHIATIAGQAPRSAVAARALRGLEQLARGPADG